MKNQHRWGQLLVALQFILIVALVMASAPLDGLSRGDLLVWIAMGLSVLGGVSALFANRLGNFNIHPAPVENGVHVHWGVYRWIRHPMYTAVMLFGLACWLSSPSALVAALALMLAIVMFLKAQMEERWLCEKHHGYANYMGKTKRFVPWLY